MQQSSNKERIPRKSRPDLIVGSEAWDMHLKGKKFNKTHRGHGNYKGAFRNVATSELGMLTTL